MTETLIITIEFYGSQRIVTGTDRITMSITGKALVSDAINYARNRYPDLPLDDDILLITVNDEVASRDKVLKANDTVCFLPGIGGG